MAKTKRRIAPGARPLVLFALAALAAISAGCANSLTIGKPDPLPSHTRQPISVAGKTAGEGIAALRSGRPDEATAAFNRALSLAPSQAELHLLAGLAYHLDYLRGRFTSGDLAETGYVVAAQLDPSLLAANLQLARLYLDTKRYARAQKAFARVLEIEPDHVEAAYGLAVASYYARDLQTALGAVRLASRLRPQEPRIARASVLVHAAAGFGSEAGAARSRLARLGPAPEDLSLVDRRMAQWGALHAEPGLLLAQAQAGRSAKSEPDEAAPKEEAAAQKQQPGPLAPNWADCKQRTTDPDDNSNSDSNGGSYANPDQLSSDETAPLRALPSPCIGRPMPRMVVIDASIIRTEEVVSNSRGVNLLDGLQIIFGWSNVITRTITGGATTTTRTRTSSLALPTAGVAYSLNIANAADLRNDVLARPSLVALDRQPSMFFSGTNITIAIPGQLSGGDIEEKPIGVSLSVTPTFVDGDTLLLAVKAARSDIEPGIPGTFTQALHTTRSSVTTNVLMRMDQTLVLSGLVEKESTLDRSRTPVLGEVPVLQYLFGNATSEESRKSILVVLTPRRPAEVDAPGGDGATPPDPQTVELRERMNRDLSFPPSTLAALRSLSQNRYIAQFRSSDLRADDWKTQESLDHLLRDLSSFLYF